MGGALSLLALQHCPQILCAAPFYGTPGAPAPFWDPTLIERRSDGGLVRPKPVQMHFGEKDNLQGFSDPATAEAVFQSLKSAGVHAELFIYPGVGHGFMDSSPWPFETYEEKQKALPDAGFVPTNAESQCRCTSEKKTTCEGELSEGCSHLEVDHKL